MKKRTWSVIIVLAACLVVLAACKKSVGTPEDNATANENTETDAEEEEDTSEEEDVKYKFGFSGIDMQNPYFITLESAVKEGLGDEDYRMITKDPGSDPNLQNQQIQEMIDEGINAIFLSPVDWEKIGTSLRALKDAGVKIINVDTQVKESEYVDAYVGSDNQAAGYLCGKDLIERCPDGGNVLILESTTMNSVNDRITGFEKALSSAEVGFEIVDRADVDGQFQKALDETKAMLDAHPEITAIMCGNDQIAVGAITALNLAERKDIIVYGIDGSPDIKKELVKKDSVVAGTVAQSPIHMGKDAAKVALAILKDNEYEPETYEEVYMINSDNVEMYGVDGWQ